MLNLDTSNHTVHFNDLFSFQLIKPGICLPFSNLVYFIKSWNRVQFMNTVVRFGGNLTNIIHFIHNFWESTVPLKAWSSHFSDELLSRHKSQLWLIQNPKHSFNHSLFIQYLAFSQCWLSAFFLSCEVSVTTMINEIFPISVWLHYCSEAFQLLLDICLMKNWQIFTVGQAFILNSVPYRQPVLFIGELSSHLFVSVFSQMLPLN